MILVETSPDGADAAAPRVTMMPRTQWEHNQAIMQSARDDLTTIFERDAFDASKQYCIVCVLEHPGSESWPRIMQARCFSDDAIHMDLAIVSQAMKAASTHGGHIAAQTQFAAFLASHPSVAGHFQKFHVNVVAGSHVQLTGLRAAAHLNGRVGVVRCADPNSERVVLRFADGSEVSVKRDNCLIL